MCNDLLNCTSIRRRAGHTTKTDLYHSYEKVNVWFEQLSSAQPELSQVTSTYLVKNWFFAKLCVTCCIYTWTELSGKSKKTNHKNFEIFQKATGVK